MGRLAWAAGLAGMIAVLLVGSSFRRPEAVSTRASPKHALSAPAVEPSAPSAAPTRSVPRSSAPPAPGKWPRTVAYNRSQLFDVAVDVDDAHTLLGRDATEGCVLGRPFVLPVGPWTFPAYVAPVRSNVTLPPRAFNPSIARLGTGYLLTYRVDWQSGCTVYRGGLRHMFERRAVDRHTHIVRLTADLAPRGLPTTLDPCDTLSSKNLIRHERGQFKGSRIADVRLLSAAHGGDAPAEVWLTYLQLTGRIKPHGKQHRMDPECVRERLLCHGGTFVARLSVHEEEGGLHFHTSMGNISSLCFPSVSGRNHALFWATPTVGRPALMAQVWMHPRVVVARVPPTTVNNSADHVADVVTEEAPSALRFVKAEGCEHLRLSGTSPLVSVQGRLIGMGHLHHGHAPPNEDAQVPPTEEELAPITNGVAYFGSHYMHFFYELSPTPPHALLRHSAEFCLPSSSDDRRCEVVQFVTGLELAHGNAALILAYGANDCETRLATIPVRTVLALLDGAEHGGAGGADRAGDTPGRRREPPT